MQAMRGSAAQPGRAKHVHLGFNQFGAVDWGAELEVEVLYAWPGAARDLGSGNTEVNNSSIVLRLKFRTDQGDQEFREERDAVDGDHIVMRSNGRDRITVGTTPDDRAPIACQCPNR